MVDLKRDLVQGADVDAAPDDAPTDPRPVVPPDLGAQLVRRHRVAPLRAATSRSSSAPTARVARPPGLDRTIRDHGAPTPPSTVERELPARAGCRRRTRSPRVRRTGRLALRPLHASTSSAPRDNQTTRRPAPTRLTRAQPAADRGRAGRRVAGARCRSTPRAPRCPATCPRSVARLAQRRSPRAAPTKFEKAVALQQWFRVDGGFRYSLERVRRATAPTTCVRVPEHGHGRPGRLLRAVRRGDGGDGAARSASRRGSRSASCEPRPGRPRTPGSTARTTCTPGPRCTSAASAGCASSRPRSAAPAAVPAYTTQQVPSRGRPSAQQRRRPRRPRSTASTSPTDAAPPPATPRAPALAAGPARSSLVRRLGVLLLLVAAGAGPARRCGRWSAAAALARAAGAGAGSRPPGRAARHRRRPRRRLATTRSRVRTAAAGLERSFGRPGRRRRRARPGARRGRDAEPGGDRAPCTGWSAWSSGPATPARLPARCDHGRRRCTPTSTPASPRCGPASAAAPLARGAGCPASVLPGPSGRRPTGRALRQPSDRRRTRPAEPAAGTDRS